MNAERARGFCKDVVYNRKKKKIQFFLNYFLFVDFALTTFFGTNASA